MSYCVRKRKVFLVLLSLEKKPKSNNAFLDIGKHVPIEEKYNRCSNFSTKKKQNRSNLVCTECDKT